MRKGIRCAVLVVALGAIGQPVTAQSFGQLARSPHTIDPALRADIERLMEVTGSNALATQMANSFSDAFFNGFKQTQGGAVPARLIEVTRDVLTQEFVTAFTGPDMRDKQVALYARHFTHEDVRALLTFYQTDIGKKAIAVMPTLSREGAEMGQDWAKENMPRILQVLQTRLKEEGLIP
jgi:hypothetical protein